MWTSLTVAILGMAPLAAPGAGCVLAPDRHGSAGQVQGGAAVLPLGDEPPPFGRREPVAAALAGDRTAASAASVTDPSAAEGRQPNHGDGAVKACEARHLPDRARHPAVGGSPASITGRLSEITSSQGIVGTLEPRSRPRVVPVAVGTLAHDGRLVRWSHGN